MKLNLHTRLLVSLLTLLLIGFTLLGVILLGDAKNQISDFHETQARYQAKTLANASLDGLVSEDFEVLQKLVQSAMPSEDYAYAALVRSDGKVLTHTNLLLIGENSSTINTQSESVVREVTYKGRPVLEVIHPALINNKILANAHVGYYLDSEYFLQTQTLQRIIIVLSIILAAIFVANHFVTRSITVPIQQLRNGINSASLQEVIDFHKDGVDLRVKEIAELAGAIEGMSSRLADSYHELSASLLSNKAIVESAIDGIIVIDEDGTIESVNSSAESIFGYSADEMLGNNINMLVPDTHRDKHDDYIQRYRSRLIGSRREVEGLRKDGTRVPLEVAIGEIQTGDKVRYASTIRDISNRYEYEQALVLAKAAAEDGNRVKSEFLANISHELRTPMNSVLGYLDLITMDQELPESLEKYVSTATRSAEELLEIINNILEFTRLENHETTLDMSRFSLRTIAESLVNDFNNRFKHPDIELTYTIDHNLPDVLNGDATRIRKVIHHFMANAFKFTKQGRISLNIDVLQQLHNKVEVVIEVRDTGIGIASQDRSRIFDLFTQADGSSTRRYGGTGIGLALCKKMVKSMGGEIGVDSVQDQGSTFWFSLHLDVDERHAVSTPEPVESKPEIQEPLPGYSANRRILIVEDNPFNQDLMLAMLQVLEYEADVVGNGKLALEAVADKHYDLILMDCQMPVMNGFEATEAIREMETEHTPIVAVTAHALDGDRELCLKSGMDDYMTKPFSKTDLQEMIRKWMG